MGAFRDLRMGLRAIRSPKDLVVFGVLSVHKRIHVASGGRIGKRIGGRDALLLHTTGRRSGLRRTTTLTYAKDGDRFLVVASKGGSDTHPDWFLNLVAEPGVEVHAEGRDFQAVARSLEGDEYDEGFRIADSVGRRVYSEYQSRTDRKIPVIEIVEEA